MFGDPPQPTGPPHLVVCESLIYATGVYVILGHTHPPNHWVPIFPSPRVQCFELGADLSTWCRGKNRPTPSLPRTSSSRVD